MKVVTKGTANKRDVMFAECNFCESKLRILYGDPRTDRSWSGFDGVNYKLRFICPVCGQPNEVATHHDHHYDGLEIIENETITKEDKEEISSWDDSERMSEYLKDINDTGLLWLRNSTASREYKIRHKELDEFV